METPVLFLVFNRPETTRTVFDAIRQARPKRLYVAADGPRSDRTGEKALCGQVRRIATAVDWPCTIRTLFRDGNMGCGRAVSEAITWFFNQEEEGIILEDDVLPSPDFFSYCQALLARYKTIPEVMMIAGCNPIPEDLPSSHSYDFTNYALAWGWASWRRAWVSFDFAMVAWPAWKTANGLARVPRTTRYFPVIWTDIYDKAYHGRVDTWDYQWFFAINRQHGVVAIPKSNLVVNLGDKESATHTVHMQTWARQLKHRPLPSALAQPPQVIANRSIDRLFEKVVFGVHRGSWIRFAFKKAIGAHNVARIRSVRKLLII